MTSEARKERIQRVKPMSRYVRFFYERGDNAGENSIDALRELFASARAAVSPFSGLEIGALGTFAMTTAASWAARTTW